MKKNVTDPTAVRDRAKRVREILAELQKKLLPEHASEFIGINVETGEYVLDAESSEVWRKFRQRWPGTLAYVIRVDGGPVVKFHGFVPV